MITHRNGLKMLTQKIVITVASLAHSPLLVGRQSSAFTIDPDGDVVLTFNVFGDIVTAPPKNKGCLVMALVPASDPGVMVHDCAWSAAHLPPNMVIASGLSGEATFPKPGFSEAVLVLVNQTGMALAADQSPEAFLYSQALDGDASR